MKSKRSNVKTIFSDNGKYRYIYSRKWKPSNKRGSLLYNKTITWILLNPSTTDHIVTDPTTCLCLEWSAKRRFNNLIILNIFPIIETDSNKLWNINSSELLSKVREMYNINCITNAFRADRIVAAWGMIPSNMITSHQGLLEGMRLLHENLPSDARLHCTGWNTDGSPLHPLKVQYHGGKKNMTLKVFDHKTYFGQFKSDPIQ